MAQTHFKEHAVWMNLVSVEEFQLMCSLLKDAYIKRLMLNWDVDFDQTGWIDDPKLGHRLHVVIKRTPTSSNYLYGQEHHEWNRIKSKIYAFRRKSKNPEN